MKNIYITVDLEEWFELDYLKNYDLSSTNVRTIPYIINFLDILDKHNVKATFFVVADIAEKNRSIITEIAKRGHTIGCHGLNHRLLYEKTNDIFYEEITQAKKIIENISKKEVIGYRSPCFSLERDKLELLRKAGFRYDSSKIMFKHHPLYRNLDLTGFEKVDDLIYTNDEFTEYEIPTLDIGKYSLPISGGGYLRLFPYFLINILIKLYENKHENYIMYLHPFELTPIKLPLPEQLSITTKFRCLVGRRNNLKKIEKLIKKFRKTNCVFKDFETDLSERLEYSK